MNLSKIRNNFLSFYKLKNHTLIKSSSLIPNNDKSLMFTNSGMVQFKKIFLGKKKIKYKRIISIQKCIRVGGKHNDLNNVNNTNHHHTFFEMLGNWSFNDYFKKEALKWSWELLTKIYNLSKKKLIITVHKLDYESYNIWINNIGLNKKKILIINKNNNNFWQMSNTGPCGYCTEIFFNFKKKNKNNYIEICNIVFIQFNKKINIKTGKIKLIPLKKYFVDTGIGLERLASILQNSNNNYKLNIFKSIIKYISKITKCKNLKNNSLKIIADHIRSVSFLIIDGILPNSNGPGYILRKLIRRSISQGYKLNQYKPFFYKIVKKLVKNMKMYYPELKIYKKKIKNIIYNEEYLFYKKLKKNLRLLNKKFSKLIYLDILSAYKLYDTYGIPLNLIKIECKKNNIKFNLLKFNNFLIYKKNENKNK